MYVCIHVFNVPTRVWVYLYIYIYIYTYTYIPKASLEPTPGLLTP